MSTIGNYRWWNFLWRGSTKAFFPVYNLSVYALIESIHTNVVVSKGWYFVSLVVDFCWIRLLWSLDAFDAENFHSFADFYLFLFVCVLNYFFYFFRIIHQLISKLCWVKQLNYQEKCESAFLIHYFSFWVKYAFMVLVSFIKHDCPFGFSHLHNFRAYLFYFETCGLEIGLWWECKSIEKIILWFTKEPVHHML